MRHRKRTCADYKAVCIEEARRKAEEARRLEEERKRAEEARRLAEEEARRRAEEARKLWEENQRKAEEARRRAEEEARQLALQRLAEEERKRRELELKRRAEEEARLLAIEAAKQRAEEERQRAEQQRLRAEAEARKRAEDARKAAEAEAERVRKLDPRLTSNQLTSLVRLAEQWANENWGVDRPQKLRFDASPCLDLNAPCPCLAMFERGLRSKVRTLDESLIKHCVFGWHGTGAAGVAPICCGGFDPGRRAGQACGPGMRVLMCVTVANFELSSFLNIYMLPTIHSCN